MQRAVVVPVALHDGLCRSRRAKGADWLFPGRRHIFLKAETLMTEVILAAQEMDLWPRLRIHDLRHTFASLSILHGVNPKLLARRLGHTSAAFTLAVYSHLYDAQNNEDADTFEL